MINRIKFWTWLKVKNYVMAYDKSIGLFINFGARSLQFKKVPALPDVPLGIWEA